MYSEASDRSSFVEIGAAFAPELSCAEKLWHAIAQAEGQITGAEEASNSLFGEIQTMTSLALAVRKQKEAKEQAYWQQLATVQSLKDQVDTWFGAIEGLDAGTMSEEEALDLLPVVESEEQDGRKQSVSKRRRAILAEREKQAALLGLEPGTYEYRDFIRSATVVVGPELVTDPRRIASGRNAKKLNAGTGVDPFEAENVFRLATADTHGGKTRKFGKKAGYYVGKSGRKIRKR